MAKILDDVVAATPHVIEEVGARLPKGFPERVFDTVTKGLARSAKRIGTVG